MAPVEKAKKSAKTDKKSHKHPLNKYLNGGVLRYSRSQMYKRRALYRLKNVKRPIVPKTKKPIKKVKKINGPKNGGERTVYLKKPKAHYPTKRFVKKRPAKAFFSNHKRNVRRNLVPGRVLILLAGRHQGKRVVLLKVLSSGLLLVTGPFALNSCPLRRISQRFVIGTSSKVNLGDLKVPEHLNDAYFRRLKIKKDKKSGEGDIFAVKKERFVPNEQRKKDQKEVDAAVLTAIKAHPESKLRAKDKQTKVNEANFTINDYVYLKVGNRKKLDPPFEGPYKILRQDGPNSTILKNKKEITVHNNNLVKDRSA